MKKFKKVKKIIRTEVFYLYQLSCINKECETLPNLLN